MSGACCTSSTFVDPRCRGSISPPQLGTPGALPSRGGERPGSGPFAGSPLPGTLRDQLEAAVRYREFAIDPLTENKVRLTHVEALQGWIAPVFEALMGRAVQRHHETFNESLKSRAEAMAAQAATGG